MAHIFEDNMNSAEYQCAQGCHFFVEELLSHLELRAQIRMTIYVVLFVDLVCFYIEKEVVAHLLFLLLILYQVQ